MSDQNVNQNTGGDPAVIERGSYEIIRSRLVELGKSLGEKATTLNASRLELARRGHGVEMRGRREPTRCHACGPLVVGRRGMPPPAPPTPPARPHMAHAVRCVAGAPAVPNTVVC